MKLWHDDIRPPPAGWVWARTNEAAKDLLLTGEVTEISMDHDLGLDHIEMPETYEKLIREDPDQAHQVFLAGVSEQTGLHLVNWMVMHKRVPLKVTIHSYNPIGAQNMARMLNDAGYDCFVRSWSPEYVSECEVNN